MQRVSPWTPEPLALRDVSEPFSCRSVSPGCRPVRLRYHRTHLPFPVSDYFDGRNSDAGPGASRLVWTVRFEAAPENEAPMRDLVQTAISDGVDGLERELIASDG